MLWLFLGSHIVWSSPTWHSKWVSNVIRDCCVCALLCSTIGPGPGPGPGPCPVLRQPIRCGTITNNCLVICVFPRFRQFDYFYCAFSLAFWVFSFLFLVFFFFRTSRGHNALPRLGLEPGLSDSEPSALTTGLLDKAVALACPRYSWPRMLKVAPCTVVHPNFFGLMGCYYFE